MEKTASVESNRSLIRTTLAELPGILGGNERCPFRFEVVNPEEVVAVKDKRGWMEEISSTCAERINLQFNNTAKVNASLNFFANSKEIIGEVVIKLELNTEPKFSSDEERNKWFKSIRKTTSELFGTAEIYITVKDSKEGKGLGIFYPTVFSTTDYKAMKKEEWSKEPWEVAYEETEKKKLDLVNPFLHIMNVIGRYDQCIKKYDKLNKEAEEKKEAYFTSIRRRGTDIEV
jgi:hypothetical protein